MTPKMGDILAVLIAAPPALAMLRGRSWYPFSIVMYVVAFGVLLYSHRHMGTW